MQKPFQNYQSVLEKISEYYRKGTHFVFALDYNKSMGFCLEPEQALKAGIMWQLNGNGKVKSPDSPLSFAYEPISFEEYKIKFDQVFKNIREGNTYLCNLTQPTPIKINYRLNELYSLSQAKFKLYIPGQFVVFSPESFVTIVDGEISTNPMKGTISADLPDSFEKLKNNPKENAEHNTIVDLLRNDLSQVADKVRVESLKYIEKIQTHKNSLWQMSSEIKGKLKNEYLKDPGNMLDKLLPAGSICGAPKVKTLEIIQSAENYDRGFYTGIFGSYDGTYLKSAVIIRFIEINGDQMIFKSGGGITFHSSAYEEYQELIQKIYVPIF